MNILNYEQFFENKKTIMEKGVNFVGIINDRGHLEDFIGEEGIPYSGKSKEVFCMEMALQNRMMKDFDDDLGTVKYTLIEREDSKFISIPASSKMILAIMKKDVDHIQFFNKVLSQLNHQKNEN